MLKVNGINIDKLPFNKLHSENELLDFEGLTTLTHCLDESNRDWLTYLVDYDNSNTRWLYGKITKEELYHYLVGKQSLCSLLINISSDYLFFVDKTKGDSIDNITMVNSFSLPKEYIPNENSYYIHGLSNYYLDYLSNFNYVDKLREKSYIVKVEPSNKVHGSTVSAKQGAKVLQGFTKSIEGYIDVTVHKILSSQYADPKKVNRHINALKARLTPRISQTAFGSLEVWIGIDDITFHPEEKAIIAWKKDLISDYKNDVLDVDYSDHEDAELIAGKFELKERKKIYQPLLNILDNDDYSIKITDAKNTFNREKKRTIINDATKNIIIPKPTIDELQKEEEERFKLINIVISVPEGKDIKHIKKSEIDRNLLFAEEGETKYKIRSPLEYEDLDPIELLRPITSDVTLEYNGEVTLSNPQLDIYAQSDNFPSALNDFKKQLLILIEYYNANTDKADSRFEELLKHIGIDTIKKLKRP